VQAKDDDELSWSFAPPAPAPAPAPALEKIEARPPEKDELTPAVPISALATALAASEAESGEDLTRPLTAPLLITVASDVELTNPLPSVAAATPYASDQDVTQPRRPGAASESPVVRAVPMVVIPPPPRIPSTVPVVVAVPRASVGVVEQAPSIQIADSSPPAPRARDAMTTMPRIPRPAPVPNFEGRSSNPSMAPVAGSVYPPAATPRQGWLMMAAAAVFGVAALAIALRPRTGELVVTVSGPSGTAAHGVSVRVDGVERCNATPCTLKDLAPGSHLVSASAAGLPPSAERAFVIEPGEHAAQHVSLSAEDQDQAGLNITATGEGLHVFVDGRDLGAPPVSLSSVDPGQHSIRVSGDSRYYAPYEQTVNLDRAEVRSIGPVRLHVLRGRLELSAGDGADGAHITVDGKRVSRLPAVLDLSADDSHEITAAKRGFADFSQQVVFDGTADRAVVVALSRDDAAPTHAPIARAASNYRPQASANVSHAVVRAPAQSGDSGLLDLTSTPPARVVVNGRPLGETPLRGVRVTAGRQTILFVLPGQGRKSAVANVAPGGHASVGVKF
jgi:hypothetical protein